MNKLRILIPILLVYAACTAVPAAARITLVKDGKPKARIVVTTADTTDARAARLLQDFVQRISGATLPIVNDPSPVLRKGDVIIGGPAVRTDDPRAEYPVTQDGFLLQCTAGGQLRITGDGQGKGSLYGVVTLLEEYLGVNYWAEHACSFPIRKTIELPDIERVGNSAFRYRQSQNYALRTDSLYKIFMRLDEPRDVFAGGYWVHTFDRLVPSERYGAAHPEYYSYFNGERHPGKASQLCLTNPDVFAIVAQQLDSIFKANPGKNIISVSQNDGNFTNCACPECKAIDDLEGSPSGTLIRFMNKLATLFPDKQISTLAYLYSMKPPKQTKPAPNVNIMLCDIDCTREVTLTENASGREFVAAMEGWSRISDNIFVWDYGINFDNYLSPFPNFHILKPNMLLFLRNHATMHFSQIASSRGGDFAELRTWMVSKLMWNPYADADSLMHTFLEGYYGAAAPYLYDYIKVMEGALIGSGVRLWIYDSPVSHKGGMLKPELMRRYNELFDKAEAAVTPSIPQFGATPGQLMGHIPPGWRDQRPEPPLAGDSILLPETKSMHGRLPAVGFPWGPGHPGLSYLQRVQRTRLPLRFAELEIARTERNTDPQEIARQLDIFQSYVEMFEVPTLNERSNSPVDYCNLYRQRYMPRAERSLAAGAPVNYTLPPDRGYAKLGETALTDELFGGSTFVESWVGWCGKDGALVIDLGAEQEVSYIAADFLHQLGQWIMFPTRVVYSLSADGREWQPEGSYDIAEDRSPQVKFMSVGDRLPSPVKARYVRVEVTGLKRCPPWHYGVGRPCWFFIDEVTVL